MCERCVDWDFKHAACWAPCYVPAAKPKGWIPATPRGGFSEEDYDVQKRVDSLMAILRKQCQEIAALKAKQAPAHDSRDSFEGVV